MFRHGDSYNNCEWVCPRREEPKSCMRYVNHRDRYGANKAACLRTTTQTQPTTPTITTP